MANTLQSNWSQLFKWLESNASDVCDSINQPASDEKIRELEASVGSALPEDLCELLRICDGTDEARMFPSMDENGFDTMAYSLIPVTAIIDAWQMFAELIDMESSTTDRRLATKK